MTPWDAKMAGPQLPVMYSTPVLKHEEDYMVPIDAFHVTVIKISPNEDDNVTPESGTRQIRTRQITLNWNTYHVTTR